MTSFLKFLLPIAGTVVLLSCSPNQVKSIYNSGFTLNEIYQTQRDTSMNIDSPAFWMSDTNNTLLIATAKATHNLVIHDAENGELLKIVGSPGNSKGEFKRPNGIFAIDDLLFVVERDNHRVQLLSLSDFKPLSLIGEKELVRPYGIFVNKSDEMIYRIYVTDNYESEDESIPPAKELGERIKLFELNIESEAFRSEFVKSFGDTSGSGMLRVVESIFADPENNKLLIAEEDSAYAGVKIYDLEGQFTNMEIPGKYFSGQIEGISLYDSPSGDGFWIVTDQSRDSNSFNVFDRNTFEYITEFKGPLTSNTDGIWLSVQKFGEFKKGVFFAIHDDGNVSAFDFSSIVDSVDSRRLK